MSDVLTNQWV